MIAHSSHQETPNSAARNMTKRYHGRFCKSFVKISVQECVQDLLDRISVEAAVQDQFERISVGGPVRDLYTRSLHKIFLTSVVL